MGPRSGAAPNMLKAESRQIDSEARRIHGVFEILRQIVADHLETIDPSVIFRVRWRLYHGWYSGQTKTFDLRAVEKFTAELKTITINKVSFGADVVAATTMLCGGARMPLYDTVRAAMDGLDELRQKMVDTGLVGDLLQSARSAREDVHVVIGDDDDLLPGIFMVEKWGVDVQMLRQKPGSTHVNTAGLVTMMQRKATF